MARRAVLTARQRAALFDLPGEEATLLRHYVLSEDDLADVGGASAIGSALPSSCARSAIPDS